MGADAEYEDVETRAGGERVVGGPEAVGGSGVSGKGEETGGTEETAADLDPLSVGARGVDNLESDAGREEEEDPTDRCLDTVEDISGLRPCIIRGGEESLGGAAEDGADDTFEGVEICGGIDSTPGDDTIGGRRADVGDSETAGAAETRGGVEALVRDVDTAAGDVDETEGGGVFMADSLTEGVISGCGAAGCSEC